VNSETNNAHFPALGKFSSPNKFSEKKRPKAEILKGSYKIMGQSEAESVNIQSNQ
jgi:hypothetical protein